MTIIQKARAAGLATNLEFCSISPQRLAQIVRPCLAHLDLLIVDDFEITAIAREVKNHKGEVNIAACLAAVRSVLKDGAMQGTCEASLMSSIVLIIRSGSMRR